MIFHDEHGPASSMMLVESKECRIGPEACWTSGRGKTYNARIMVVLEQLCPSVAGLEISGVISFYDFLLIAFDVCE